MTVESMYIIVGPVGHIIRGRSPTSEERSMYTDSAEWALACITCENSLKYLNSVHRPWTMATLYFMGSMENGDSSIVTHSSSRIYHVIKFPPLLLVSVQDKPGPVVLADGEGIV